MDIPLKGHGNHGKKKVLYIIKWKGHGLKANILIYYDYFNPKLINKYKYLAVLTHMYIALITMPVIDNDAPVFKKRGRPHKTPG